MDLKDMKYVLALGAAFSFVVLGQEISIHATETDTISVESISNETYESESESFETFEIDTYSEESALKDGWNGDSSMYVLNGEYVKGLIEIDGNMYYFSENGIKQTGFVSYLGQTLYFDSTGKMVTGLQIIDGSTYYFEENGNMFTGFISISKEQVNYFGTDGKMVFGENIINGNHYFFDLNTGAMASGFVEIDGKTSYYNELGIKQFGNFSIDKDSYTTDENGIIIETVINGVTYYNQKDSQWANVVIGMGNIGSTGCVPTTATMVVNTITGTNYTPVDLGNYLYSKGVYNKTEIGTISTAWKIVADKYGLSYKNNLSYQDVLQALLEGHIVTGSVGYSYWCPWTGGTTHEIMMVGLDEDGYTTVYDPYNRDKCGRFLVSQVWNVQSKEDYDLLDKGPFFSLGYLRDYALYNNLETCGITQVSDAYYTGSNVTPNVAVSYKNGNKIIYLTKDVDYTLSYENNKDIGKGSVIIQGIHNFFGKVTSYFDIIKEEIEEGTFEIHSFVDNSKVIDVSGSSTSSKVQINDFQNTDIQKFEIIKLTDGYHVLKNCQTGYYLLTADTIQNLQNGKALYQGSLPSNSLNGRFILKKNNDGTWLIESAYDYNFVLDLYGANVTNGSKIILFENNNQNNQLWFVSESKLMIEILDDYAAENKSSISDGTYIIGTKMDTNCVMDVYGGSVDRGANVTIYEEHGKENQAWIINHDEKGYVTIKNVKSGLYLSVLNGTASNLSNIGQSGINGYASKWIVVSQNGGYRIVSALNTNYMVDLNGSSTKNGTNITLYKSNGLNNQAWVFEKYISTREQIDTYASANKTSLTDGTYIIGTKMDTNCVMDVYGGSGDSGANVTIYEEHGKENQAWIINHDEKGYVTIKNVKSGLYLSVLNGTASNLSNIGQSGINGYASKWIVVSQNGGYRIVSALNTNYMVDLNGSSTKNGTNITLYKSNGLNNQAWVFEKYISTREQIDTYASENKTSLTDGTYIIGTKMDTNCVMDVYGGSGDSGANVTIYEEHGKENQAWIINHDEKGYVTIKNVKSGLYLSVLNGTASNLSNIGQSGINGYASKWIVVSQNGGYRIVSALNTNYMVDLNGSSTKNGTNITLYKSNGLNNQLWVFK